MAAGAWIAGHHHGTTTLGLGRLPCCPDSRGSFCTSVVGDEMGMSPKKTHAVQTPMAARLLEEIYVGWMNKLVEKCLACYFITAILVLQIILVHLYMN